MGWQITAGSKELSQRAEDLATRSLKKKYGRKYCGDPETQRTGEKGCGRRACLRLKGKGLGKKSEESVLTFMEDDRKAREERGGK